MNKKFLKRIKDLNKDHSPEGWPAIQMKDINRLVRIIEEQQINIKYLESLR